VIRLAKWSDRRRELPDEISALSAALRLFGKQRLREGQLEVILAALRGENVLAVRPTGSGKTLCFQLPAVMSEGLTVVLCPLKALMRDHVQDLQTARIPGTFINGDVSSSEKKERYELLEQGAWKFMYCAPERFGEMVRPSELERLSALRPTFLVVDEAHCVDRWGEDFRPDYARIAEIRKKLGDPPILAFTATAGPDVQRSIEKSLQIEGSTKLFVEEADRPNIALVRHELDGDDRDRSHVQQRATLIARLVRNVSVGRSLIFVPTIRIGNALQSALRREGLDLPFYHSRQGLPHEREQVELRFKGSAEPELRSLIATNAFGMGVDVSDIRLVINWQHPASVEDYLQEFGRAGRDGDPAVAVLLTNRTRDEQLLRYMADKTIEGSLAGDRITAEEADDRKRAKHDQIAKVAALAEDRSRCFRQALLDDLAGNRERRSVSLAHRLLRQFFLVRTRTRRADFCCDACNPERAQAFLSNSTRRRPGLRLFASREPAYPGFDP
jgi:ATP-dependent DNA helicase RecQ